MIAPRVPRNHVAQKLKTGNRHVVSRPTKIRVFYEACRSRGVGPSPMWQLNTCDSHHRPRPSHRRLRTSHYCSVQWQGTVAASTNSILVPNHCICMQSSVAQPRAQPRAQPMLGFHTAPALGTSTNSPPTLAHLGAHCSTTRQCLICRCPRRFILNSHCLGPTAGAFLLQTHFTLALQ